MNWILLEFGKSEIKQNQLNLLWDFQNEEINLLNPVDGLSNSPRLANRAANAGGNLDILQTQITIIQKKKGRIRKNKFQKQNFKLFTPKTTVSSRNSVNSKKNFAQNLSNQNKLN